jgi:hypothetical protein
MAATRRRESESDREAAKRTYLINSLISVVIFVGLFITLELLDLPVGTLVGLAVSLIAGVSWWLMQQLLGLRSYLDERFARVSLAAKMYEAVASSAIDTDESVRMLEQVAKVDGSHPGLLPSLFDGLMRDLSAAASNLTSESGNHIVDGEDELYLLALTRASEDTIRAASQPSVDGLSEESAFWVSDLGRRYLEAQRRAISERGVKIWRLFVVDASDVSPTAGGSSGEIEEDSPLGKVMRKHQEAGIQCRYVISSSDLPVALVDSILFDECVYYQSTLGTDQQVSTDGSHIHKTRLTRDRAQVGAFVQAFDETWQAAKSLHAMA